MKHVGMSTQNDITTCFETCNKERFCSFPHRHCDSTKEASDSRRDMLEHQNEHFVRDFLKFHTPQRQNRRFPTSFLMDLPQTRHFVPSFHQFSSRVTKCRESAAPVTQSDIGGGQSAAPATKNATHLLKTSQKYCACHTKPRLTRHETCWNVTKCHVCDATLKMSKSDPFCSTYQRHGHSDLVRTVADGCELQWIEVTFGGSSHVRSRLEVQASFLLTSAMDSAP